jgi:hypothetical protein
MPSDKESWRALLSLLEEEYRGWEDVYAGAQPHEFVYALGMSAGIRKVMGSIKNLIDPVPETPEDVQPSSYRISADEYARARTPAP